MSLIVHAAVEPIADQSVPTGNNATFICVAVGAPSSVMYNWTHDVSGSVPIDSMTADRAVGINTNMLTIMNVGVQDEDGYRCTVSVDGVMLGYSTAVLSVVSESHLVFVQYSIMTMLTGKLLWKFTFMISDNSCILSMPHTHTHTHTLPPTPPYTHSTTHSTPTHHTAPFFNQTLLPEYLLTAGDNLTLTCIGENPVGAESPLFIQWRFDFTFLNESDPRITNMMIGSNQLLSQLLIPNIQPTYRGEFGCYLSNRRTFETRNAVSSLTNVTVFCELP